MQESRAKGILRTFGIKVPDSYLVRRPEEIVEVTHPVVVKAQVLAGGRGKAGGVRVARNLLEAKQTAKSILGMSIGGQVVRSVLIEREIESSRELYLALAIDRRIGLPIILASTKGGMDIESVPDAEIGRWAVHPFLGMQAHLVRAVAARLEVDQGDLAALLRALWGVFWTRDCELVEINPLVLTSHQELVAVDAKMMINDDALYRHPELGMGEENLTSLEQEAKERGIALVQLDGDIGVIANGAGLTMATLDAISFYGGRGGVFLDLGGTDDPAKVEEAYELMLKANPKVILVNIFGGITKCDTVAQGLINARGKAPTAVPLIARIRGVNEELARDLLLAGGIAAITDLDKAASEAVRTGGE